MTMKVEARFEVSDVRVAMEFRAQNVLEVHKNISAAAQALGVQDLPVLDGGWAEDERSGWLAVETRWDVVRVEWEAVV